MVETALDERASAAVRAPAGWGRGLVNGEALAPAAEDGLGADTVGQHISNQSSFDPRNYGYASLSKLLAATQLFEFKGEGTGSVAVRDKRNARQS